MEVENVQILIVMGVSGSGKTTVGKELAQELGWAFIEGDQFHCDANIEKMASGTALTDKDRDIWLSMLRKEIEKVLAREDCAVIACSALKESYRHRLNVDDRVQFVFLNIPFSVAEERLKKRKGHFMPVSLLESQFATLQQPEGAEYINVDAQQLPQEIVKEVVEKIRK
jgi:gluconokinase